MRLDPTISFMLFGVILAFIFPNLGAKGGPFHLDLVAKYGVSVIFFIHGANLSFEKLKAGLANWRLHLISQGLTYLFFPIVGILVFFGLSGFLDYYLRIGIFFLCTVSSTIASSITMTGIAGGNIGGAVWDATISGLIGIFFTPFMVSLVYKTSGTYDLDVTNSVLEIAKAILLPFLLGHLFMPLFGGFIARHKKQFALIDRTIIIIIVFTAFCQSNLNHVWNETPVPQILLVCLIAPSLLGGFFVLSYQITKSFKLPIEDRIAAVFVGSTKSLANGAPIAAILFAGDAKLSLILLPLLVYHQAQLIAGMALAQKWARIAKS